MIWGIIMPGALLFFALAFGYDTPEYMLYAFQYSNTLNLSIISNAMWIS